MYDTNRKIAIITLLAAVTFAAVIGGVLMTQATVANTIDTTNSTTDNSASTANAFNFTCPLSPDAGFGMMQFGRHGFEGSRGFMDNGGFGEQRLGNIQVSQEFNTTVTNILNGDSDVQNLLNSGYNITAIMPIYTSTLDGNGTVTTQATTAIVVLQNGTTGHALVNVDIAQSKVTRIETVTRTVIDKS